VPSVRREQDLQDLVDSGSITGRNQHIPRAYVLVRRNDNRRDALLPNQSHELICIVTTWVGTHNHRALNGSHGVILLVPAYSSKGPAVPHRPAGIARSSGQARQDSSNGHALLAIPIPSLGVLRVVRDDVEVEAVEGE
jgi:hypothetical protein